MKDFFEYSFWVGGVVILTGMILTYLAGWDFMAEYLSKEILKMVERAGTVFITFGLPFMTVGVVGIFVVGGKFIWDYIVGK